MLISEIYQSPQGEGLLTGQESIFVRTSGCNLRCDFCDTPYTSWDPEGEQMSIDEIMDRIGEWDATHVVITGGEPMIANQLPELTREIKTKGLHITIETAGTVFKEVDCDLMSISPKLSNSTPAKDRAGQWVQRHEERRLNHDVVSQLIKHHEYQLKFVVSSPGDLQEIKVYCDQLGQLETQRILLMPEGTDTQVLQQRESWIRDLCDEHGFTYCPRMHIVWFGNRRGT